MRQVPNGQRFKNASRRRRAGARQKKRAAEANAAAAAVLFETFEPRVLLDAALPVPPNGTVLASDTAPATVQDADGTSVDVSITGNGHWQIVQEATAPTLTVTGTDTGSVISITTTGGNGRFLFSGIDVEGPAASLTGTGVDLNGGFKLAGPVARMFLGDLTVDAQSSVTLGPASTNTAAALTVGETTNSALTLNGASTLESGPTIVGDQAGAGGSTLTVSGTGTQWQVNGGLTVGEADSGSQVSVNGGATAVIDTLTAGDQNASNGTVSVSGAGTRLSVSGLADFGVHGTGLLSVGRAPW